MQAARIDFRGTHPVHAAIRAGRITHARRLTLGGNDAVAMAALEAGARFFAGYPITPSTDILEYVARHIFRYGGTYLEMEDEIAAMGAIIGASLGGVKSFTATSGPGFSLKGENLGFACFNEIPLVVVNVQRGGPSTGGPTDVAQADVLQARWGTHGDHPIVVVAPASVQECWEETIRAFNISERYRIPVIILSDAKVGQMKEPVILPAVSDIPIINRAMPSVAPDVYEPFGPAPDGVPPLAPFGSGYRFHVTGLNHGRRGLPAKDPRMIDEILRRIHAKLETEAARRDIVKTEKFFTDDAEVVFVAFGVTSRAARDAVITARREGKRVGLLRPITLFPEDDETFHQVCSTAKRVIVAELNLGQYLHVVKEMAGEFAPKVSGVNKVDSGLITPDELLRKAA